MPLNNGKTSRNFSINSRDTWEQRNSDKVTFCSRFPIKVHVCKTGYKASFEELSILYKTDNAIEFYSFMICCNERIGPTRKTKLRKVIKCYL